MKATEIAWAIFDKILTALMVLACALVILDTLAVTVDVILRYSLGMTWTGLFEITEYSLLWITFLSTAWILRVDGHIRVDLVLTHFNPRRRAIVNIVTSIFCIILLCILTWYSVKINLNDYQTGRYISSILQPVKWPIEIIIPVGYFLLLIELLRKTYGYLTSWKAQSGGEQEPSGSTPGGES
jgi:TRAP-type C4-dicarboxylate transport system permease small subunit